MCVCVCVCVYVVCVVTCLVLLYVPVHYVVVIALVMVNVMSLHMMVDGMDKVVVKGLEYFLHTNMIIELSYIASH